MHINSLSEYNELAKAYDIFKRDDNYPAFFSLLKRSLSIPASWAGMYIHSKLAAVRGRSHISSMKPDLTLMESTFLQT